MKTKLQLQPRRKTKPPTLSTLFLLTTLTFSITSDCGFIKLLDKIKEYDGENADILTGKFDKYMGAQFSVFGFMRILGTERKTYSMFKFDNNVQSSGGILRRNLQEGSSGYDELMSISFAKYNNSGEEVNLLIGKGFWVM
jgi:hypothetical protein